MTLGMTKYLKVVHLAQVLIPHLKQNVEINLFSFSSESPPVLPLPRGVPAILETAGKPLEATLHRADAPDNDDVDDDVDNEGSSLQSKCTSNPAPPRCSVFPPQSCPLLLTNAFCIHVCKRRMTGIDKSPPRRPFTSCFCSHLAANLNLYHP